MDSNFPLTRTLCYKRAARLMSKGATLSVALRGCADDRGPRASAARNQPHTTASSTASPGRAAVAE